MKALSLCLLLFTTLSIFGCQKSSKDNSPAESSPQTVRPNTPDSETLETEEPDHSSTNIIAENNAPQAPHIAENTIQLSIEEVGSEEVEIKIELEIDEDRELTYFGGSVQGPNNKQFKLNISHTRSQDGRKLKMSKKFKAQAFPPGFYYIDYISLTDNFENRSTLFFESENSPARLNFASQVQAISGPPQILDNSVILKLVPVENDELEVQIELEIREDRELAYFGGSVQGPNNKQFNLGTSLTRSQDGRILKMSKRFKAQAFPPGSYYINYISLVDKFENRSSLIFNSENAPATVELR